MARVPVYHSIDYEERFAATSQDWEVIDLCEQNDWYFEKNGARI